METVEQLLPDFFANIQGNSIEQYFADIRKAEVETAGHARCLINSRLDTAISWANSFRQPEGEPINTKSADTDPTVYKGWTVATEQHEDGWYYLISRWQFKAKYGPFVGPACAKASGTDLVDVLEENIEF